jgi:valine--pyruvate aminotransferase
MSQFSKRFSGNSGIVSLMEDLGKALNENPEMIFMGGGNPAQIPEVEQCIAKHLRSISEQPQTLHKLVGEYQPPQGDPIFLQKLAEFLNKEYDWKLAAKNIAVSNGGQSAFFALFNLLATEGEGSDFKKIVLPMVPDYLGYTDAGLDAEMFTAFRPRIKHINENFFKYHIDFDNLALDDDTAAVCLSRPTNPSSNIVTDEEVNKLKRLCDEKNVPLILDLAYGKPFPGVTFVDHSLAWDKNTILIMSMSKLGLPGVRTGIVIAHEDIIQRFSRSTASLSLAPGNFGPTLFKSLLDVNDLMPLMTNVVQPYYKEKMQQALDYLLEACKGLPVKFHKPEGAFFLWLWFQNCPIKSEDLYHRLKDKGVMVLSGHHFFQALGEDNWPHRDHCMRLSYCQPWERVKSGIDILAEELKTVYESELSVLT